MWMSLNNTDRYFYCEKCNKTKPISEKADKKTRDGRTLCDKCMIQYEIEWDEYEDWLEDDHKFDKRQNGRGVIMKLQFKQRWNFELYLSISHYYKLTVVNDNL